MLNFEKGIPLKSIHFLPSLKIVILTEMTITKGHLSWGEQGCQLFDFGSRILIRRPGKRDELVFPHILKNVVLKDAADVHMVLQPEQVGVSGPTAATPMSGKSLEEEAVITEKKKAVAQRIINKSKQ